MAVLEMRSAVFIVLMLGSAALLDDYTSSQAHHAIEELFALKPLRATLEREGQLVEVAAGDVKEGDMVVVSVGQRAPVDGVVVSGSASFNESSVTGESAPIIKRIDDAVISGTLNEDGSIKMRATGVGKNSTIERMAELIDAAQKNKSRSEKLADRFAGWFLPVVAVVGVGAYVVTGQVNVMIALFLVACADDMAVAIPLAMMAAMGQAARRGVIFKGGEWIDTAARISTIVLDKTGTLTYGQRHVQDVRIAEGVDEWEFWTLCAGAEKMIDQPLGRAIYNEAAVHIGKSPDPDEFVNRAGKGVVASVAGKQVVMGSELLLSENGIVMTEAMRDSAQELVRVRGTSAVFVAVDGAYAGVFGIADVPRAEAGASIATLRRAGIRSIMLTGDNEEVAAYMAQTLGINEYRARMLPEDKLREVESLMRDHAGTVAVVGDGINDAPALSRADVGIAMGTTGMAVAVEAADIVILTDDLSRLADIITIGRTTRSIVYGDMVIWLITNAVGFSLVLTGFMGPAFAAFYNFATDFLPIMNSMRLFRR